MITINKHLVENQLVVLGVCDRPAMNMTHLKRVVQSVCRAAAKNDYSMIWSVVVLFTQQCFAENQSLVLECGCDSQIYLNCV